MNKLKLANDIKVIPTNISRTRTPRERFAVELLDMLEGFEAGFVVGDIAHEVVMCEHCGEHPAAIRFPIGGRRDV